MDKTTYEEFHNCFSKYIITPVVCLKQGERRVETCDTHMGVTKK